VSLAGRLGVFWSTRGHLNEGRVWLESAVSRGGSAATTLARAKALNGAGLLAMAQDDVGAAKAVFEEGLALYRETGDKEGIAFALTNLVSVAWLGQRYDIPVASLIEEANKLKPDIQDQRTVAHLLLLEGGVAFARGDLERVVELWEESLAHFREVRDARGVAMCLMTIGHMKVAQGDYGRAGTLLRESLRLAGELDHKQYVHYCTIGLGSVAASQDLPSRAARLWGPRRAWEWHMARTLRARAAP
jgi:tetratricopeptide (TPR) repeat protein